MNIVETEAYRAAFAQYLRKGTPIRLSLKQAGLTTRYVWRTRRDEKVRPSHRRNAGRILSWTVRDLHDGLRARSNRLYDHGRMGNVVQSRCPERPVAEPVLGSKK